MDRLGLKKKKRIITIDLKFFFKKKELLPAVPGELLLVRRQDIENGVNEAVLRGLKGSYLNSMGHVRWCKELFE